MKIFLLLCTIIISLLGQEETCYSIQLFSIPSSKKYTLKNNLYPKECKIIDINGVTTIRCGCFSHYSKLKKLLPIYKKRYKYATITTSYKHIFNPNFNKTATLSKRYQKSYNQELKLLLQTFLYAKDLKNAYKVAKLGYKNYPDSYYWNQKLAEVAQWSGHGQEALDHLIYLYKKFSDQKIGKDIINLGLNAYQYEKILPIILENVKLNPNNKNIKMMIYIYSQVGEPEKAAKFLMKLYKKQHKTIYLTDALRLYINLGDFTTAKSIVRTITNQNLYTVDNVKLLSYYYYIKKDMQKAFLVLNEIKHPKKYDKKFYQLQSDLGWYIQDYKKASYASIKLIEHEDGRVVDYERVLYTRRNNITKKDALLALKAYKKYHQPYLFYTFAQNAIKVKDYDLLDAVMSKLEQNSSEVTKDSRYWIIRAEIFQHYHKVKDALKAVQNAIKLNPQSLQTRFLAIYLYLNLGKYDKIEEALSKITNMKNISPSYYFPLASIYSSINEVNKAKFYINKLFDLKDPIVNSIEFKFLQADLYRAQFEDNSFYEKLREIRKLLRDKFKKNPATMKNNVNLYNYLRAQMYLVRADEFERELKEAKPYLDKQSYYILSYNWAAKNGSKKMQRYIYNAIKNKELWLQLSMALLDKNKTTMEDLLYRYLYALPIDDASYAAQLDGQISLAQTVTFHSLEINQKNQNAYITHLNLSKQRDNLFDAKISYQNNAPTIEKKVSIKNSNYINNGYTLASHIDIYDNQLQNLTTFKYVPKQTLYTGIGIKKQLSRGDITIGFDYNKRLQSFYTLYLSSNYRLNNRITFKTKLSKNSPANESTQLLFGGKKDAISILFHYDILKSTYFEANYIYNRYNSQDNIYLGDGNYVSLNLSKFLRQGYPDIRIGLHADYSQYKEKNGPKGIINKLYYPNTTFTALPNNSSNIGLSFSYGMVNSNIYTRVWRPYFEASSYYNTDIKAINYSFHAGYGGKVYTQDHLSIGLKYSNYTKSTGGNIFELYFRYQFLYDY